LRIGFHGIVVAAADLLQNPHLVHPTAFMSHTRVHGLDGGG
jgi:hypothetical protein